TTNPETTTAKDAPARKAPAKTTYRGLTSQRQALATGGPRAAQTVAKLLEATKSGFLTRGFAGTSVDEIAQGAGVSRATFYTYFPGKREALIALGTSAVELGNSSTRALRALPRNPSQDDFLGFIKQFFEHLDSTGPFSIAWSQAAHHDAELRDLGL